MHVIEKELQSNSQRVGKMLRYARGTLVFYFCLFLYFFCPTVFSELPADQTETMISISKALSRTNLEWDVKKDPCLWRGVTCSPGNLSVSNISLSGFSLSSSEFLPLICNLHSLVSLNLSNNQLTSIPKEFMTGCGKIEGLQFLDISRNKLGGPLPDFPGFLGLQFLDLSSNYLTGNIVSQLQELGALRNLNLGFNSFNGSLPTNLGKAMALEELRLLSNSFVGNIPDQITDYQNLTAVDLSGNKLNGSVPASIGKLSKLEFLILSSNNLGGEIPESLSNITTLSRFAANQNNLQGSIPRRITRYLRNLDVSYNKLNGAIPSDILLPSNLQTVDLSYNLLEGPVPSGISQNMIRLRLGSNSLNGTIPPAICGTLSKLMYLELDNNTLMGSVPTALSSCKNLTLLNLAGNGLSGILPGQLGGLHNLEVLKLQSNNLNGEIPDEIFQLTKLLVLNISRNSLHGRIPWKISSLEKLTNLNLQSNNLSGAIPATLASMKFVLELQLGSNKLNGEIPGMPVSLQIALNLSNNLLEGPIPDSLSRLSGLEVLDLSSNKLSGSIPEFLVGMKTLTQLNLSNNQLSGTIPNFGSWVVTETGGNKYLSNATAPTIPPKPTKKVKSIATALIAGFASALFTAGVLIGLAMAIGRRYYRINEDQSQSTEDLPRPQVLQGNLLTANGIHRSNIDFTKAMEAVADPSNVMLKTRFSTYYKAIMPAGSTYFVKKINWSDKIFQLGSHHKFWRELSVLGKLSNSNVMTPLAYVLTVDSAYLFYEFAPKGTLFDLLHGSLGNALDWPSRYSIAVGVAQGLAFLHGCTCGPILLLDLSSKNIMLKSLKEPQVGDIELYKVIDPSMSTGSLSTVAGSVGYIPPEYAYTMRVTIAGNVYSFGVVLLELLTGKPAVNEGTELAKWVLSNSVKQDKWDRILDPNVSRKSLAIRSQMLAVLKVAIACVNVSPDARPKMKNVLRMLLNAR